LKADVGRAVRTARWGRVSDTVVCGAGVKISDAARLQAAGVETGLVAQRATEAYLMQVWGGGVGGGGCFLKCI
jgi:hypothetical protein